MKRRTKTKKRVRVQGELPKKEPATASGPKTAIIPKMPRSPGKPYTIQVAAFKAAADADTLVARLKQRGFTAYRKFDKVQGKGIWYRVRVGEFKNRAEAKNTIAKLKKAGYEAFFVKK